MPIKIRFIIITWAIITNLNILAQKINNSPFNYNALLTADYVGIFSGGIKKGNGGLADMSLQMEFDTKKAGWWQGGTFFTYFLYDHGFKPSPYVGSNQTFDNIETDDNFQFFEYWYKQRFTRGFIEIGQSNINTEFFHSNQGCRLINSNFNTQPDITLNAHVPIFSKATLGFKFRYDFSQKINIYGCVYNGYEGTPEDNPYNTTFYFRKKDGLLYMVESQFFFNDSSNTNLKVGAWLHTGLFLNSADSSYHDDRSGVYLLAEKNLIHYSKDNFGLGVFLMTGYLPTNYVIIHWYAACGVTLTGILMKKTTDILVLGITTNRLDKSMANNSSNDKVFNESLAELSWQLPINKYITVQPDLQYFLNPGASKNIDHAFIGIIRVLLNVSSK